MSENPDITADQAEPARGYASAMGAYMIWGLILPVFMKMLAHVSPVEIVAHRIVWALPFAVILLGWIAGFGSIRRYLTLKMIALAALCACVISVNWGVYIYAIGSGQGVAAALGYYINPLVSLVFAVLFLGERPSRQQWIAIALAATGVLVMTVVTGGLPWIALALASSFGLYGLLRKLTPYGATEGFFLEVAILFVPALAIALWTLSKGTANFGGNVRDTGLLILAGPLTAIPLILFATGARLLKLSTIGILQYSVPTLLALTAVYLFGEPFGLAQLGAFAFIWAGLAVYTASLLQENRARRRVSSTAAR